MQHDVHFNNTGAQAVCGEAVLSSETSSTSAFKSVTCPGCRRWVSDLLLRPRGFQDPVEWQQ